MVPVRWNDLINKFESRYVMGQMSVEDAVSYFRQAQVSISCCIQARIGKETDRSFVWKQLLAVNIHGNYHHFGDLHFWFLFLSFSSHGILFVSGLWTFAVDICMSKFYRQNFGTLGVHNDVWHWYNTRPFIKVTFLCLASVPNKLSICVAVHKMLLLKIPECPVLAGGCSNYLPSLHGSIIGGSGSSSRRMAPLCSCSVIAWSWQAKLLVNNWQHFPGWEPFRTGHINLGYWSCAIAGAWQFKLFFHGDLSASYFESRFHLLWGSHGRWGKWCVNQFLRSTSAGDFHFEVFNHK